ncbi:MAG: N-acetylmuramoyl-L-alanine amidase [Treponema sp.]|nr:N-acetylmuramoyl-L-alanine amidase [Treponema sp.]
MPRTVKLRITFFLLSTLACVAAGFPAFAQTLSLDEALASLSSAGAGQAHFRWDPFFSSGAFTAGSREASFSSGRAGDSGAVLVDHRDVLTLPLPYTDQGAIRFPETFVTQVRNTFAAHTINVQPSFRVAAIVIDPGHGGRDPGAIGKPVVGGRTLHLIEKDIVLDVSKRLHALLAASFPDKKVLLTRSTDVFRSLAERADLANTISLADNEAAIFVSVHANASFNKDAQGFEVFYLSPGYRRNVIDRERHTDSAEVLSILNSMMEQTLVTESILLANNILKSLDKSIGTISPNRGIKPAEWFVVRNARMPSVLVELGFITNESDAPLFESNAHLNKLAKALYNGISDFVTFFERPGGMVAAQ